MGYLLDTLNDELKTALRLERKYSAKLRLFPRGSFIIRSVRRNMYGYLTRRENGRVIQEYLGRMDHREIDIYRRKIAERQKYKVRLAGVREQIKILKRALRGKTA